MARIRIMARIARSLHRAFPTPPWHRTSLWRGAGICPSVDGMNHLPSNAGHAGDAASPTSPAHPTRPPRTESPARPVDAANHANPTDDGRATAETSATTQLASTKSPLLRGTKGAKGWIPDQPGAWVMALSPALAGVVTGAVLGHLTVDACWLLACWALCYCVEFTAGRWLKAHGSRRYLRPMLVYCIVLAAVGLPFVALHPGVLVWAPIYMVLLAADCMASWWRRERTLWANAVAVTAACLMPMLTVVYGLDTPEVPYVSLPGLALAVCFAAVQFGSVLFVKTMIRERGRREYLAASWVWHFGLLALWGYGGAQALVAAGLQPQRGGLQAALLIALAALLLARAVALPLIARRRPIPPMVTGMVESVASLVTFVCLIAVGAL